MSNLSQFFGGSLYAGPLIWVEDRKDFGTGGGHYGTTSSQYRVKDMNRIVYNSISGASLVNDGTTSSAVGAVGTQGIVNNPASGTHNTLSHVILPAGTYVLKQSGTLSPSFSGHTYNYYSTKLYNKTDGSDIGFINNGSGGNIGNYLEYMFELSATKNIDIRVALDTDGTISSSASDLGAGNSGVNTVGSVNLTAIFFKVA